MTNFTDLSTLAYSQTTALLDAQASNVTNAFDNATLSKDIRVYVKGIILYGADPTKTYYIKQLYRSILVTGKTGTRIIIYSVEGDNPVCLLQLDEAAIDDYQVLDIPEYLASGISAKIAVVLAGIADETNVGTANTVIISKSAANAFALRVTDEINEYAYPLIKRASNQTIAKAIKSITLDNADRTKYYYVAALERAKDYIAGLGYYRWILTINEASDITSAGATVCQFLITDPLEDGYTDDGVKVLQLATVTNGITGKVIIDWDAVSVNSNTTASSFEATGFNYELGAIDTGQINKIFEIGSTPSVTKIIDKNGNGDYLTLTEGYDAYVGISTFENQVEFVMMPGVYINERQGLKPIPYSITRAKYQNTVTVVQSVVDGDGGTHVSVIDLKNTCRLQGLIIDCISSDMYALHTAPPINSLCILDECVFKYPNPTTGWALAGDANGSKIIFNGGGVISSKLSLQHSTPQSDSSYASKLIFNNFAFGAGYSIDSLGCNNNSNLELNNCTFQDPISGSFNTYNNSLDYNDHPADNREWYVSGGGNKGLYFSLSATAGQHLKIDTTNVNENITAISGTALEPLFGVDYITNIGGSRVKGNILSQGDVRDVQVGGYPDVTLHDLIQMWKRLGDCSIVNKTLSITVDAGIAQVYTFTDDFDTLKTVEATILSDLNTFFTNVDFSKTSGTNNYNKILLAEKKTAYIDDATDILIDEVVIINAANNAEKAIQGSFRSAIAGLSVETKANGEELQIWTGVFKYTASDGEYGVGADNKLSLAESEKIGYVSSNVFYPYY